MLRQYIRRLLEVYELSDEEKANRPKGRSTRRAIGLQDKEAIIADREYLQNYHQRLHSNMAGLALISDFQNGDISICHGLNYFGFAAGEGKKDPGILGDDRSPFTNWLKKYGNNSKDALSCVAFNRPMGDMPREVGINDSVWETMGFYMKGYPIYVSEYDVMSQTLGALPTGLVQHQKQSGIAKRPGTPQHGNTKIRGEIDGVDWDWAGEVLLDNWKPIGIYINVEGEGIDLDYYNIADFIRDAEKTGLPIYIFSFDVPHGKYTDMKSLRNSLDRSGESWSM